MHEFYLEKIKSFEGFSEVAGWDYAQHSVGFGTKARFPGERISLEEADQRFRTEIDAARAIVEKHAGEWDEGTKAALTSLTFNAGTRWVGSGLGDAVRAGDVEQLKERFLAYNRAGGEVLPGLVRRRAAELAWIGSAPATVVAQSAATAPPATPAEAQSTASLSPVDKKQVASHARPIEAARDLQPYTATKHTAPRFASEGSTLAVIDAASGTHPRPSILAALSFDALVDTLLETGRLHREDGENHTGRA